MLSLVRPPKGFVARLQTTKKTMPPDFSRAIRFTRRPFFEITEAQKEAVEKMAAGQGDILLLDGTPVTLGTCDCGRVALMPLNAEGRKWASL